MTGQGGSSLGLKVPYVKVRFLIAVVCLLPIISCSHYEVKSLCVLNFDDEMCWVNKEKNIGFTFKEMGDTNRRAKELPTLNSPIWFALDSYDLERIVDSL